MNKPINIYEAKTHLSKLVDRAAAGEEIVISRAGKPMVRMVPVEKPAATLAPRPLGIARGQIWMAPDFDELPEDIQRAFEGEDI
ncbi:MAG: type II toxin-antitoxin system prevent-host-death family antitoxin [Rhodospirillaceae bacterium]|nr:type II toxin-antitoxin system prevent-host-death family antitoxin [Rhodospirillaceae bacterium]